MIITRLFGGIGNQMFQYSVGRALSTRLNTDLKLDISSFNKYPLREYNLYPFNIKENFATSDDLKRVTKRSGILGIICDINIFSLFVQDILYYHEKSFNYDSKILTLSNEVYLDGYWQSEKYFIDIMEQIKADFQFKNPPDTLNKRFEGIIMAHNSVCIHIRRGDFLTNQVTNRMHGVCSIDYYHKGIENIANKIDDPHFFLFSDDPIWVKENIILQYPTEYISHNSGKKSFEDLRLMSLCQHHIIANSTFSWWGAWLNSNPKKIIIAPKKWFNESSLDTKDLIPSSWIRL